MRVVSPAAAAALQGGLVPMAVLVEMDLSTPVYLNTSSLSLVIGGITYSGTGGLGTVGAVQDTPAEIRQLQFSLSAVPSASIALALAEPVQGKAVRIKLAIFDPSSYQLLDVRLRWAGRLDVFSVDDGAGTATIAATAEHAGIDLVRPYTSYYSDTEQRRLYPGDLSLQFMADQTEQKIVWPAATWGRK